LNIKPLQSYGLANIDERSSMNSSEADNQNNTRAGDLGLSALISDELRSNKTNSDVSAKREESKGPT